MRIALFTTSRTTIPPQPGIIAASAYLTGLLADGLVERGHEVTLYAPQGSVSKANIIDLGIPPVELDYALHPQEWVKHVNLLSKQQYISAMIADSGQYDVIHLQTEPVYAGFPFVRFSKAPVVATNHNVFLQEESMIWQQYRDIPIVTISRYQRSTMPEINHFETVYDGIPVHEFPLYPHDSAHAYIGFIGRLVRVKGVEDAIAAAKTGSVPLVITGVGTKQYIESTITPNCSDTIQFAGPLEHGSPDWYGFYRNAKALLVPIQWDEPFGLVMVEAMAMGTPIIAYARGSVPEIVEDGVTGFLVNPSPTGNRGTWQIAATGVDGLREAMMRIWTMDAQSYGQMRQACRDRVQRLFDSSIMIDNYIKVYERLSHPAVAH